MSAAANYFVRSPCHTTLAGLQRVMICVMAAQLAGVCDARQCSHQRSVSAEICAINRHSYNLCTASRRSDRPTDLPGGVGSCVEVHICGGGRGTGAQRLTWRVEAAGRRAQNAGGGQQAEQGGSNLGRGRGRL